MRAFTITAQTDLELALKDLQELIPMAVSQPALVGYLAEAYQAIDIEVARRAGQAAPKAADNDRAFELAVSDAERLLGQRIAY